MCDHCLWSPDLIVLLHGSSSTWVIGVYSSTKSSSCIVLIIFFSERKWKCFVLQWHWIRQIFTYTETHADPEEVWVRKELTCSFGVEDWPDIIDHVLTFLFNSFYPLYPPVEEVNTDYEKFQSFAQMPLTPDVLIIPSELRYFVKVHTESKANSNCYNSLS